MTRFVFRVRETQGPNLCRGEGFKYVHCDAYIFYKSSTITISKLLLKERKEILNYDDLKTYCVFCEFWAFQIPRGPRHLKTALKKRINVSMH
jgi:hypothetical protein